jgi:Tol biopolymer transport system component/DNA-binding winged helix-turn-helix (wHTH) protein
MGGPLRDVAQSAEILRFGPFEVDLRSQELRRKGMRIRLPAQSFQVLATLLNRPGDLVTREELQRKLWPAETFGDLDHGLNAAVNRVREALDDSAEQPRFIETLPRRGYRFISPVERDGDRGAKTALEATANAEVAQVASGQVHPDGTETAPSISAASTSTAHPVRERWKGRRFAVALAPLLLLLIAGAFLFQYLKQNRRSAQFVQPEIAGLESGRNQTQQRGNIPSEVPEDISVVPLTVLQGREYSPAFSPDGSQVAFAWDGGRSDGTGRFDLYAKVIGSERVEQLTHHPATWIVPAWSPDGRNIAFARQDAGESGIFMVSARGGPERKLADATFCKLSRTISLSWSPDGRELLYAGIDGVHLLTPENDETRSVTKPPQCSAAYSPAFSPDGQWIAFSCVLDVSYEIHVLPAKGGTSKALTRVKEAPFPLAWSADSKRIVYSENWNLFEISSNGGKPQRLMFAHDASQPAISTRGERLAYSQGKVNLNLWRADLRSRGQTSTALMFPTSGEETGPHISPDGKRIVFESERSGSKEIWVSNLDGSDALKLSNFHSHTGSPRWSPDGQRIVFDSRVSGAAGLYLVDPNTALPKRIATNGLIASLPTWSMDGRWIYFRSGTKQDEGGLYRVSPQGGNPQLVSQTRGYNVQQSKSGSTLYFIAGIYDAAIRVLNITTGEERSLEGMPRVGVPTEWVVGSKGIFFIDRSSAQPSIDFFEFASARVTKRIPLPREPAFWGGLALAPDETWLAYAQIDQSASDLMLAEGFH